MIETPRVKAMQTDTSAASGHKLDPDEIAKVGPSHVWRLVLLTTSQGVCIPYGAKAKCMDPRARFAVRNRLMLNEDSQPTLTLTSSPEQEKW